MWDAPICDGGAAVAGYTVTIAPDAGTVTVSGTTATIIGLDNGTGLPRLWLTSLMWAGRPREGCRHAAAVLEFPPLSRQSGFGCQAATAGAVGRVLS